MMFIDRAAETLLRGGIIAYPTDGVFGLGCLPDDADAIRRLLQMKHRDPTNRPASCCRMLIARSLSHGSYRRETR